MKSNEFRALIRREIARILQEDTDIDIKKAKDEKLKAIKKVADLEKKKADADIKNAQKGIQREELVKLNWLLEADEDNPFAGGDEGGDEAGDEAGDEGGGDNPFAGGGEEGGGDAGGGDNPFAGGDTSGGGEDAGGEEAPADEEGGDEEEEDPDKPSKSDDLSIRFNLDQVKKYNPDADFAGEEGVVKKVSKDGLVVTVQPDNVDVLVSFDDISEHVHRFFKSGRRK